MRNFQGKRDGVVVLSGALWRMRWDWKFGVPKTPQLLQVIKKMPLRLFPVKKKNKSMKTQQHVGSEPVAF